MRKFIVVFCVAISLFVLTGCPNPPPELEEGVNVNIAEGN